MQGDAPFAVGVSAEPADDAALCAAASQLAQHLGLPLVGMGQAAGQAGAEARPAAVLVQTSERLELRVLGGELRGGRPIFVNPAAIDVSSPAGRSMRQPLARAIGLKRYRRAVPGAGSGPVLTVVDATAGLGEDTWLMAGLGCRVLAVERSPVVHALLADGLRRAAAAMPGIAQRITLIRADAREVLSRLEPAARGGCALVAGVHGQPGAGPAKVSLSGFGRPDVVLLDPMFPPGRKTAERKRMRVLRALVGHDMDAGELLGRALVAAARRVVVKRPVRAEPLGGRAPTVSHAGKALRYDVYAVAATS